MQQTALRRSRAWVAAAGVVLVAGLVGPRRTPPVLTLSPSAARADEGAKILEHKGQWESGYGATFYNVVGGLENTSGHALAYVKIRVEALDGAGKVVASTDTYNESAEALSVPEAQPDKLLASGKVKPLAAGREERFRASFLKEDAPALASYRVRIVETPPAK